ncbi:MAG: electron transfer flavoprotein subunit beta/FixA family protein [Chitinophagales bacterium]|nr:electron transfer flavoprotein subunit beta/FixA family protein [Chitinophagales bacterium]MDW8428028.1 electron transfer flavoprotein subunit beta/FixA family protein [Chitinophagales bacterium]
MKILVCISRTPDTTSRVAFTDNNTRFDADKVQFIINPYDEWYALVRAVELQESQGAAVTLLHVGGAEGDAILRKALAIGGDRAIRIDAEPPDAYFVAVQIAAFLRQDPHDLVLVGKETIDYNGSQVGGMIAGLLEWPFVSLASRLELAGSTAVLERDISGGKEEIEVPLPVVVSCAKGMAEQRIPNMRGIMAARTKPLTVRAAEPAEALAPMIAFELPKAKQGVKLISPDQPEELVRLLHVEAKVI